MINVNIIELSTYRQSQIIKILATNIYIAAEWRSGVTSYPYEVD